MHTVKIQIHEVGLRDGLQIEQGPVPFETKLQWAKQLMSAGVPIIQLGSFVHPERVPQMADTDRLFSELTANRQNNGKVTFSGLVLNEKGVERGLDCGVELFCMGVSASNTHSQKNTGMGSDEAMDRIISMGHRVLQENKHLQVSVQSAFGCGFEGEIPKSVVMNMIKRFRDAGFTHISLADTAGYAQPMQVLDYYTSVFEMAPDITTTCHFHDTFGAGIANCFAAYQAGVRQFETSFGGLGGCPFTKISSGNVCSEDLVWLFQRMGHQNLPDLKQYINLSKAVAEFLGRELWGRLHKIGIPSVLMGDSLS